MSDLASPFGFDNFSFRGDINIKGKDEIVLSYPVLIYKGSISYWRTRESIDLWIYEHQIVSSTVPEKSVCVEIVAFNPIIGLEAPHIFLVSDKIYDKLSKSEEAEDQLREQRDEKSQKKNIVKCNTKFTIDLIVNYVLSRVIVESNSETTFSIVLSPQLGDTDDVITMKRPSYLKDLPTTVQIRKEVDQKEKFDDQIKLFNHDIEGSVQACDKARRMSENAIDAFSNLLKITKQRSYRNVALTVAQKKWHNAIQKVTLTLNLILPIILTIPLILTLPLIRPLTLLLILTLILTGTLTQVIDQNALEKKRAAMELERIDSSTDFVFRLELGLK